VLTASPTPMPNATQNSECANGENSPRTMNSPVVAPAPAISSAPGLPSARVPE
jgi:hypothetical protein